MKTFVDNNMVNSQTYNEILMVGVKDGQFGAKLTHSVGIIVKKLEGDKKQVLFFDQDYERKLFLIGKNTHDYEPVNYEKLFDAYHKITLYKLTGINVNSFVKKDIDVKMKAVLNPTPENVQRVITLTAKKTNKKRKN